MDEITRALENFLDIREQAIGKQFEALNSYQLTMNDIDGIVPITIKRNKLQVDHNLLRHLGISLQPGNAMASVGVAYDDNTNADENEYNDEEFTQSEEYHDESFEAETSKGVIPVELSIAIAASESTSKIETRNFDEKLKLRSSVLDFMASSREKEDEMETVVAKMKEDGVDLREIDNAREALYQVKVTNADTVRKSIQGYKPVQGTKSWAKDPEYSTLLKLFEDAILVKKKASRKKRKEVSIKKSKKRELPGVI
jgi:hypothetical protein